MKRTAGWRFIFHHLKQGCPVEALKRSQVIDKNRRARKQCFEEQTIEFVSVIVHVNFTQRWTGY